MTEKHDQSGDPIHTYARENLSKGECAVGKFRGQTALFIPPNIVTSVTTAKIRELVEEVYTKPVLDKFGMSEYECSSYFLLELPPIEGPADCRIDKLIKKLQIP